VLKCRDSSKVKTIAWELNGIQFVTKSRGIISIQQQRNGFNTLWDRVAKSSPSTKTRPMYNARLSLELITIIQLIPQEAQIHPSAE